MFLTLFAIYFLRLMLNENETSDDDVTAGIISISIVIIIIDILFTISCLLMFFLEIYPHFRPNRILQLNHCLLSIFMPIITSFIYSIECFKLAPIV